MRVFEFQFHFSYIIDRIQTISKGNSMICGDIWQNTTSDISKLLYVISRAVRRVTFETKNFEYHEWYLCQISRTNHAIICLYYYPAKSPPPPPSHGGKMQCGMAAVISSLEQKVSLHSILSSYTVIICVLLL